MAVGIVWNVHNVHNVHNIHNVYYIHNFYNLYNVHNIFNVENNQRVDISIVCTKIMLSMFTNTNVLCVVSK